MSALFAVPPTPLVPVRGESDAYPVHRIFCVGRNFAEHAAEMGFEVDREAPFYFTKPPSCIVLSGAEIPYPPGTSNLHHELELVVAIGGPAFRITAEEAEAAIFGYACGFDMTRRDLQLASRAKQRPWSLGKAFENSAAISEITRAAEFGKPSEQRIWLEIGDHVRQDAHLSDLIWSVPELISHLSNFYHLVPGDLIYTGTPAGVGAVLPGDTLKGQIEGLEPVVLTIGAAE